MSKRAEFTTQRKDAGKPKYDMTGQRFERLTVVKLVGSRKGHYLWLCHCDCGQSKVVARGDLVSNKTRSCGCLRKEVMSSIKSTHGLCKSPEYSSWCNMIDRCKPTHIRSKDYHARGITISREWRESFETFLSDMGLMPSKGMTLERTDNNKGYGKGNCCWATKAEQNKNRRPASEWNRTAKFGKRRASHACTQG